MKPQRFDEANSTLKGGPAELYGTAEDVGDLPVWKEPGNGIASCWSMTWRERLSALIFGRVWLHVQSDNSHPPVRITARRRYFTKAPR